MELSSQVVSLDLAKRLKELGVKQESYFSYFANAVPAMDYFTEKAIPYDHWGLLTHNEMARYKHKIGSKVFFTISAFTVAELGEMLFQYNYYHLEKMGYLEITTEKVYRFSGDFYRITNNLYENIIDETNEVNARAKILIYLVENGIHKNETT